MKHVVHKAYWDFEKEEAWLNAMAARGMLFSAYSAYRYVFDEGEPGAYTYRIELLEQLPSHPESVAYLRFLEDNGVEHVASYLRWVYLRRRREEGPFELYSDNASRMGHYKRVSRLWTALMSIEWCVALYWLLYGLGLGLFHRPPDYDILAMGLFMGLLFVAIGFLFCNAGGQARRSYRRLLRESRLRE